MYALLEQQRRGGVSQVVEADTNEARPFRRVGHDSESGAIMLVPALLVLLDSFTVRDPASFSYQAGSVLGPRELEADPAALAVPERVDVTTMHPPRTTSPRSAWGESAGVG